MPDVSVVIATRNRPDALRACLEALAGSTLAPERLEVVVVDDGGEAPAAPTAEAFAGRLDVRTLRVDHGGPAAARNVGVREARGSVAAFTDDDCVPRPGWAERLREAVAADRSVLAGGRIVNGLGANPYAAISHGIVESVYAWVNADPEHGRFLASNNMAVDRDAFLALGGFDESFRVASEDRELCDRWRRSGGRIVLVEDAVVEHNSDLTLAGFAAQHVRYGRGAHRYHRVRRRRGVASVREEMGFLLAPRRWPWASGPGGGVADRARDAGLVLLWQAANTAGYAAEAVRSALGKDDRPDR